MDFSYILKFLQSIARNNNRAWFEKNKPAYLQAKEAFDQFLEKLLEELIKFEEGLAGLNPKKLAFRIYRDVRFSKDKRPYKVNMGAGFSPGGKMIQEPGYYLHIEPGNKSLLAGGLYMPDANNVAKIRQEIDYNFKEFKKIIDNKDFKKYFGEISGEKLARPPKGYDAENPAIEYLKHKSFLMYQKINEKDLLKSGVEKQLIQSFKAMKPFNDFMNRAMEG